jgi:hypothetical protein
MRMDFSHWVAAGAVLGVVAACWARIKAVCWRLVCFFLQQVEIQDEATQHVLVDHLIRNYKHSRYYDKLYGSFNEHTTDGKYGLVPFELLGKRSILFWHGWFPFVYTGGAKPHAPGSAAATAAGAHNGQPCTVTFLRGTLDIEKIIKDACDARNAATWDVDARHQQRQRRFFIRHVPAVSSAAANAGGALGNVALAWYQQSRYRLLKHQPHELGKHIVARRSPLEDLIFPQRVKDLIREIRIWRNHKEWYQEHGIAWKRGWLCFGPPGTGKTALARAFAEELDMPLFVYNLAEIGNFELIKAWSEMQAAAPCVALIEDIDNVFHGRENVVRQRMGATLVIARKKKNKNEDDDEDSCPPLGALSFDTLLNCLDGVERSEGVFTIVTTNDVSKVDPALGQPRRLPDGSVEFISTRPGRIDKAVELTYMEPADKLLMARRILGEYEEDYLRMVAFVERFPDLQESPAQFQERCAQVALARFWEEHHRERPRTERAAAESQSSDETVVIR